jgi:hypothetical protein
LVKLGHLSDYFGEDNHDLSLWPIELNISGHRSGLEKTKNNNFISLKKLFKISSLNLSIILLQLWNFTVAGFEHPVIWKNPNKITLLTFSLEVIKHFFLILIFPVWRSTFK